jgi:hypothetical protein
VRLLEPGLQLRSVPEKQARQAFLISQELPGLPESQERLALLQEPPVWQALRNLPDWPEQESSELQGLLQRAWPEWHRLRQEERRVPASQEREKQEHWPKPGFPCQVQVPARSEAVPGKGPESALRLGPEANRGGAAIHSSPQTDANRGTTAGAKRQRKCRPASG